MIEVRKHIPQVYNQSRDFSVFMGLMQVLINELDVKSISLSKLPLEDILPYGLSTYPSLRKYFRFLLKEKGSIESILQAIFLSGGKTICRLEDESRNAGYGDQDYRVIDRNSENLGENLKNRMVYYYTLKGWSTIELNINLEDPGQVDQGLLGELLYYIKPVNVIIKLRKGIKDI